MCNCKGMWEGHTTDLFEEITIEEALSDSIYEIFRRYANAKKEMVRSPECETAAPLDACWSRWGILPCDIPGSTDSKAYYAQKIMEATPKPYGNGPSIPEG